MADSSLLGEISRHLERRNLADLFCNVLNWDPLTDAPIVLPVGAPLSRNLTLTPVAQLKGLPVLRVDWPSDRLPGVVQRRAVHKALASKHLEHLLCYETGDRKSLSFVWAHKLDDKRTELRTLPHELGSTARTTVERLAALRFQLGELRTLLAPQVADRLRDAFSVEAVTEEFFKKYREVFERVEREVRGIKSADRRRLFTQKLFNRLMFVAFIQKKGWVKFKGSTDYLMALWSDYGRNKPKTGGFYDNRLKMLFFQGLNTPNEVNLVDIDRTGVLSLLIGDVPYLNGGLFEQDDEDQNESITVPDDCFEPILKELFGSFNFTVAESTPLDVEVAVDPEMLGRVFEELVTGRHETGSYYTPRPVVSFMCREALKGYLGSALPGEKSVQVARFVEEHEPAGLLDSESVLGALRRVTVVDPACGSGAYLLGMLHELFALRQCLFQAKNLDPKTAYERKLEIIQHNLYGVDLDPFAVNIARLRLWLSLAVDHEGKKPEPLPNLDFKIEQGDSLTARNPEAAGQMAVQDKMVQDFQAAKDDYLMAHGQQKLTLRQEVMALKEQVALWTRTKHAPLGFDWPVEFAEVFRLGGPHTTLNGELALGNELRGQMDIAGRPVAGGFDVVLANPPYVRADPQYKHIHDEKLRQEEVAKYKVYRAKLLESKVYQTLYEKWDLYMPFLERAHQLLRPGGQMTFIIPDAYNAAKYATRSHEFFLTRSRIQRIDFCSEIPLFEAGVYNTILHFTKDAPSSAHVPVRVRRWGKKADEFEQNQEVLSSGAQAEMGAPLFRPNAHDTQECGVGFVPLGRICYISKGMVLHSEDPTGKEQFTKDDLVSEHRDRAHPKPFFEGKYMTKWAVRRVLYLEYGTKRAPVLCSRPTFPELYEVPEKLISMDLSGSAPKVAYDQAKLFHNHSAWSLVPWLSLRGVRNRSIRKAAKYADEVRSTAERPTIMREQLEELSRRFDSKYLLAIMNSDYAAKWLDQRKRSKMRVYPDDWKALPIPDSSPKQQQPLVRLVDSILSEFSRHGYPLPPESAARVAELEREIDERVKALYGL